MKTPKGKNIPARIKALQESFGVNEKTLAQMLRVSESSVKRWKNGVGTGRAGKLHTLHLLEKIAKQASKTFEKTKVSGWFNRENLCLGGLAPVQYIIQKSDGYDEVKNLLGRIEWGIPS